VGIENKIAKPVVEIIEHIAQKVPRALGHGHHRIAEHTGKAADEFDKVEETLEGKARKHTPAPPSRTPGEGSGTPGGGTPGGGKPPRGPEDPGGGTGSPGEDPGGHFPPAGEGTKHLETLDESRLTRDENGLITEIDGRPVSAYLRSTAETRAEQYRAACADPRNPLSKKALGDCIAVGVDRRTGRVYEGINGRKGSQMAPDEVHPTVQGRVDAVRHGGPYPDENGDPTFPYPHPDIPLRHAEVKATNQALHDRAALGLPDDASALPEIMMHPHFVYTRGGMPAPFCANCHNVLGGVDSASGRFTGWPPGDDNRLPGVTS
jgi:hypothetical protein